MVVQIQGTQMLCHSLAFQVEKITFWKKGQHLMGILIHIHNITGILTIQEGIIHLMLQGIIRHLVQVVYQDHIQCILAIHTIHQMSPLI